MRLRGQAARALAEIDHRPFQLTFQRLSAYTDPEHLCRQDFPSLVGRVVEEVTRAVNARAGGVMLHVPETDELVLQKPAFGVSDELIERYRVPLSGGGNAVRVFLTGQPYLSNAPVGDPLIIQSYVSMYRIRGVMSVPLQIERRRIGVLHVINPDRGQFTERDLRFLQLLASQVAAVLHNARVVRDLRAERDILRRLVEAHDELLRAALAGGGLPGLARALSRLVGGDVTFTDRSRRVLAWGRAAEAHVLDPLLPASLPPVAALPDLDARAAAVPRTRWVVAPIVAGGERLGHVWALPDEREPVASQLALLERAAAVCALEMLRQQARWVCQRLRAAVQARLHTDTFSLVYTEVCQSPRAYATAFRRATGVMDCLPAGAGKTRVFSYSSLGPLGLLAGTDREALAQYCESRLGALMRYDAAHGTGLLETLAAYLERDGKLQETADALFIHINSLRYRLKRIGDISGLSLADSEERFRLRLALRILPLLRRRGLSPPAAPPAHPASAERSVRRPPRGQFAAGPRSRDRVPGPIELRAPRGAREARARP